MGNLSEHTEPERRWSERSLVNMADLHPDLKRVLERALVESPLDFIVIEGLRKIERQRQLFGSGKSKTMNSKHLRQSDGYSHAVDLLPIGYDGRPAFDWKLYDVLGPAIKAAAAAEGVPIVWGGDWETFRDGPHFELRDMATKREKSNWNTETLPDDCTDVLIRQDDDEYPITRGYHADGYWWNDMGRVAEDDSVIGWMTLEEAAHILDSSPQKTH